MLTIIPILLLLLTAIIMAVIHLVQPKFAYFWLIAAMGSLLTWLVVVISGFRLPESITLATWNFGGLFPTSLALSRDSVSWPFALALATLTLSVIFTAVARMQLADWQAWTSSLGLTAFGLLAVLARNPLTVLMAWAALDMLELVILLAYIVENSSRQRIVISFTGRVTGIILLVGAILLASSAGKNLSFDSIPPEASIFLLLAAILRLGVLPYHLPISQELPLRRGLGTTLRLIPAATSLALLARTANVGVVSSLSPWLLLLAGLAALYSAWSWVGSRDELGGRPFWTIATAGLAVTAAVLGQPGACLAWGLACLFSGGLIFLNSVHTRNILPFSILGLIGFSAIPFTPNWNGVELYSTSPVVHLSTILSIFLSLIILCSHALLLVGYARHMLRTSELPSGLERWVWVIYPLGLAILIIASYLIEFRTRLVIKELPWTQWAGGAAALSLAGVFWLLSSRQLRIPRQMVNLARRFSTINWFYNTFWILYQSLRLVIDWITSILEGDGGILWAVLLLTLLLSLLARQGFGG